MDVLHVVPRLEGTTIPVEICAAVDDLDGVRSRAVSEEPLPDALPDTIEEASVLSDRCGFDAYGRLLSDVADAFDAVHTHHIRQAAYVGATAATRPILHVNTQHGHLHYTRAERLKNLPGLLTADAIAYNSRSTADSYGAVERLCKVRTTERVVHNGVDMSAVEPYRVEIDEPTIVVTAARLIPRKNLGALIEALEHADGYSLTIIGDGPHRAALERLAEERDLDSRVSFAGYLPDREDVYEVFAGADVFALPSHGEGFCVAAAEAMAVGLPVVVSDIGIFHEVVGEHGIFVDRRSPRSIADALTALRNDPERARRLGRRNGDRIREQFTLAACARGYRDLYRDLRRD